MESSSSPLSPKYHFYRGLSEISVRLNKKRMRGPNPRFAGPTPSKKNIFIKDLEKEFERRLGTKVDIKPAKKGGKLVVTYYSDDDLDRIKDLIGQSKL